MSAGQISMTILQLASVPLLVLLNGFFVAAEFALVKIRDTQLETLVAQGHRRAKVARRIVRNLDAALDFYCNKLGLKETRRRVDEKNKYTLVFLGASEDEKTIEESKKAGRPGPEVELTYNWDSAEDYGEARYFGHLAYEVDDIYATCERLMKAGVTINRPPRDGRMAFVRSPDLISIEFLQKGKALPPKEPWASMPNSGKW